MLGFNTHHVMFDELGDDGLVRVVNMIMHREYGEEGLEPYPSKGKDRGTDGKKVNEKTGTTLLQVKFREVSKYPDEKLRKQIMKTYDDWLADLQKQGVEGHVIYVTNVRRVAADHGTCDEIAAKYVGLQPEYWDFDKLVHFLDEYEEIAEQWLPAYNSREIRRIKKELAEQREQQAMREKEQVPLTPEYKAVSGRMRDSVTNWPVIDGQYLGFIILVEPLLVDDSDGLRKLLGGLYGITAEAEAGIIERLTGGGQIKVTGNLITVAAESVDDANAAAAGLVSQLGPELAKLLTLMQGA